jgi:threonyl-tRNA synthetase
LRNEKITYKIREHSIQRIPYLVVIGDREVQEQQVTVRAHNGNDLGLMSFDSFLDKLNKDIDKKV